MKLNIMGKIGLLIGILGGLVGVVVAFMEEPIIGIVVSVILVFTFGFIYSTVIRPGAVRAKLLKSGTPAQGKIIEVNDTGVTVNQNPQVKLLIEVTPPGRPVYRVETKMIVSRLNAAHYLPGATLGVRVDLNDPRKIAIETIGAGGVAGGNYASQDPKQAEKMLRDADERSKQILANGEPAPAIVMEYMPMNINVNGNNPAVELKLKVLPESGKPFEANAIGIIKESSIPKYQPGEEIFIKFDRNDHSKVAINHS